MEKKDVQQIIHEWKQEKNIKLYTPLKYFDGLKSKQKIRMKLQEMYRFKNEKDPSQIHFESDKGIKNTKKSHYHTLFETRFKTPSSASLKVKSNVTGVPEEILKIVERKGQGAWKSGHRPGTNAIQWGKARVDSFLTFGCTAYSGDKSLMDQVRKIQPRSKELKYFFQQKPSCPKSKLKNYSS